MSDTEMTQEPFDADDLPTQALVAGNENNDQGAVGQEIDPGDAPTQALTGNTQEAFSGDDTSNMETQAFESETNVVDQVDDGEAETQAIDNTENMEDANDEEPTQAMAMDDPPSRSRSRSNSAEANKSRSASPSADKDRSKSRSASRSRSRSRSAVSGKSGSRSRSPSGDRSRSRSKSGSRSRNVSGSRSRSRSGSRSQSRSRSRSGSRSKSRSRSGSRSRSRSRSKSGSRSRSVSRSRSRSRTGSDSDVESKKKKVVKEALGDSDDEGGAGEGAPALPAVSDSDGEGDNADTAAGDNLPKPVSAAQDSDSDDDRPSDRPDGGFSGRGLNDFDAMMEKKRSEMKKRRKKKDIDLINDNDDAIARLIADMRVAAREDRDLNEAKSPAIKKIAMLPLVMTQLRKADLQMAFVEANVLSVMTDWLAPMPDRSLPSLKIRQELLKLLLHLKIDDQSRLKESGIGKAVMYLYKHPRELKENKLLAGKIINNWARPIFNKSSDYRDYDKEERRGRDVELVAKKRRQEELEEQEEALRPGDPGWIGRARVPMPASYQYVKRPKWQNDVDIKGKSRKEVTKLDKHIRAAQERKRMAKSNRRAVEISIEGRKTAL